MNTNKKQRKLRVGTVCSGIGAPEQAWQGGALTECFEFVFCAEIEDFPSAVLSVRHPGLPNFGDMNDYANWPIQRGAIDVLVGGTPCQSFSVAGLRKGLADPRGNLALTFLAIVERYAPTWVVWENVPGVFSSWSDVAIRSAGEESKRVGEVAIDLAAALGFDYDTARKFGAFEEVDQSNDLDCFTAGLGKLGYGWGLASLDAQFFGVAQRRERVFVVGHIGGEWQRAAAVLFDRESMCGNPAPRRETGERTAYDTAPCIGASGRGFERTGETRGQDCVIPIQEIGKRQSGTAMNGVGHGAPGDPMFTLQKSAQHGMAIGFDSKQGGDTQLGATVEASPPLKGQPRHAVALGIDGGEVGFALRANASHSGDKGDGGVNTPLVAHSLRADGFDASEDGTGRGTPLIPEVLAHGQGGAEHVRDGEPSLTCNHEAPIGFIPEETGQRHVSISMAVRRLTPRECERLQGFPDDYTLINYRGKPAADGPRYKALANSMAVPVMRWIGERIVLVHQATGPMEEKET